LAGWTNSCSPPALASTPSRSPLLCAKLVWLGEKLAQEANTSGRPRISAADSAVSAWVMIAQHTLAIVRPLAES
jgi:hypothetical protein